MRKIRGGALIGQGTYGCVMSPPPKSSMCEFDGNKKHMPKMSSMVAKIFTDDKNADEEWEMAKQLKEIDARQDYFLYALNRCYTRMSDFAQDPDVEQCEIVGDMIKQSRQQTTPPTNPLHAEGRAFNRRCPSHGRRRPKGLHSRNDAYLRGRRPPRAP